MFGEEWNSSGEIDIEYWTNWFNKIDTSGRLHLTDLTSRGWKHSGEVRTAPWQDCVTSNAEYEKFSA